MMIPVNVPSDARPLLASERRFVIPAKDHPLSGKLCPACDEPLAGEQEVVLVVVGIAPSRRKLDGWTTGGAVAVHVACAGEEA